jgi:hypothetical protein
VTDSDRVIPPGKEGTATLEVNTISQFGETSKSATLYTNDPDRPTVVFTLSATVIKGAPLRQGRYIGPVFVSPDSRAAIFAYPGKKAAVEFAITAANSPVKILRVEGGAKYFAPRVEVIEPGRSYKILVESKPNENSGTFSDEMRVVTDSPALPAFRLRVNLTVYSTR